MSKGERKIKYIDDWTDWPQYQDISLNLHRPANLLRNEPLSILSRMLLSIASQYIDSYSPKVREPKFTVDKCGIMALRCTRRVFQKHSEDLRHFFIVDGADWYLRDNDLLVFTKKGVRVAIPLTLRQQVFERDGCQCVYCGNYHGPFHIDHIVPVSVGGPNHIDNLVVACQPCNLSKGAKTLDEWDQACA